MQKLIEGGSPEGTTSSHRRGGGARLRLLAAASIAAAAAGLYGGVASAHTSTYRPPSCGDQTSMSAPCNAQPHQPYGASNMTGARKGHSCECEEKVPCECEAKKPRPSKSVSESPTQKPTESAKPTASAKPTESAKPTVMPSGAPKTGGGGAGGSGAMLLVPLAAAGVLAPVGFVLTRRRRVAHE